MLGYQLTCGAEVSVCGQIGASCPIVHTERPGDIPSVCIALAFRQVVRLGASWCVLFTCLCLCTPQLFAASALLCPFSSFRAHMDELQNMWLCRYRPPHGSHTVQRLQALCPAHRLHAVPSVHRFRRAPPALSQVTLCQPRSLRLPSL